MTAEAGENAGESTPGVGATNETVALLAAAGDVYVYASDDQNIDAMESVLDLVYPGSEVVRRTLPLAAWEVARSALLGEGITIIDVRNDGGEATP